jgi:Family of unknown function (DUF5990)
MSKTTLELPLRVVLEAPTRDVVFALQRGKDELIAQTLSTGVDVAFNFTVNCLLIEDAPDFRGSFVQGPRGGRFVYINAGELAGQAGSPWRRRAKISLGGISASLITALNASPSQVLCAHIAGKGKDGGPPAASVPLLNGWVVMRA